MATNQATFKAMSTATATATAQPDVATPLLRSLARVTGLTIGVTASCAASSWLAGYAISRVYGNKMAPWILGRAAGISAYLLIVALVAIGLLLSHPAGARLRRPRPAALVRIHVSLAVFTLAFTVLHIAVLAEDSYAGVGWRGALLPGLATYRPLAVTLGVIGCYAGLLAGITAAAAGRFAGRVWWPIHKVAIVSLLLVWTHGVLAGSDTPALQALYIGTGVMILLLAISRYGARTRADEVKELLMPAAGDR